MLLQFSVTNHRSIKDTAIISLKASTDKSLSDCLISPDEKKQLVPVLALYGANAAGKSNVLHALLLMREMVCGRYAKLLKGEALPQEPFAFTEQPPQPTSFEVIYFYNGIKYAYGFSFDKTRILTEYLYHWPNGREALIFPEKAMVISSARIFRSSLPLPDAPQKTGFTCPAPTSGTAPRPRRPICGSLKS